MKRADLLAKLGLAPLAVAAAPFLARVAPATPQMAMAEGQLLTGDSFEAGLAPGLTPEALRASLWQSGTYCEIMEDAFTKENVAEMIGRGFTRFSIRYPSGATSLINDLREAFP